MTNFDLEQAKNRLIKLKDEIFKYLNATYLTKAEAEDTFEYLEEIVDLIIKRKSYNISFEPSGSPLWHSEVLAYVSEWIEIENELGLMMSRLLADESI